MTNYDYIKDPCSIDRLLQEIQLSAIATTVNHINLLGNELSIFFPSDLSAGDKTILDTLVANHSGLPLSVDFNEYASTSSTSTNSSSYVLLNSMISDPLIAGTYLVTFNGTFSTNVPLLSNPAMFISCFVDGVQVVASEQSMGANNANDKFSIGLNCRVSVGTNKVVEIRWKNNGSGNTITCTTRILDILKVN